MKTEYENWENLIINLNISQEERNSLLGFIILVVRMLIRWDKTQITKFNIYKRMNNLNLWLDDILTLRQVRTTLDCPDNKYYASPWNRTGYRLSANQTNQLCCYVYVVGWKTRCHVQLPSQKLDQDAQIMHRYLA